MRPTSLQRASDRNRGYGTAGALLGLILLAVLVLTASSLISAATRAVSRSEDALRLDLESRRSLIAE